MVGEDSAAPFRRWGKLKVTYFPMWAGGSLQISRLKIPSQSLPLKDAGVNHQQERLYWEHAWDSPNPKQREARTEEPLRRQVRQTMAPRVHGQTECPRDFITSYRDGTPPCPLLLFTLYLLSTYCAPDSGKRRLHLKHSPSKWVLHQHQSPLLLFIDFLYST